MTGLDRALRTIGGARAALPGAAGKAVGAALERALKSARETVPVDTGRLRDSLRAENKAMSGVVTTACPYALAAENRRPYLSPAAARADFAGECEKALKEVLHD